MNRMKKFLLFFGILSILSLPQTVYSQILQRKSIKTDPKSGLVTDSPYTHQDYAPFLWYKEYYYQGEGNEFATFKVTRTHPKDNKGRYQYVVDSGARVAHVVQVQKEQVVERAYFVIDHTNALVDDYRYSPDANDLFGRTIIPADLGYGTLFYNGYYRKDPFRVVGILQEMEVLGQVYYDVLLVESDHPYDGITQNYYAPKIGLIQTDFISSDGLVSSKLKSFH